MRVATDETIEVRVSVPMARQLFRPCDPEFIRDVCHARCCDAPGTEYGAKVSIFESELPVIQSHGGEVDERGFLKPREGEKGCPFKEPESKLCVLHATGEKPSGCIASPFTFNRNRLLIVRNRYRLLKCYKAEGAVPAYRAHFASLVLIFGAREAERIRDVLDAGTGEKAIEAWARADVVREMETADAIKRGRTTSDEGGG